MRLTVADDGCGFRPEDFLHAPVPGHLGLRMLTDMAHNAGGRLDIDSEPAGGTRLRLELPADPADAARTS